MKASEQFEAICDHMIDTYPEVKAGKMMSSPALKCKDKVFAFFHKDSMTFKLGRDFVPEELGITKWSHLSPFKNKAPLYDWISIPDSYQQHWSSLCELALKKMS